MAEKSLNRTELVEKVADSVGQSRASVNAVIEELFKTVSKTVASGGKVTIPGWFSAAPGQRSARTGRNPRTGEVIQIPASKTVKLSAGSKLKDAVKK